MHQILRRPTHKNGNTLDVFICNKSVPSSYQIYDEITDQEIFDHYLIKVEIVVNGSHPEANVVEPLIIDHNKTDWDQFRKILKTYDWESPVNLELSLMIEYLSTKLNIAYELSVRYKVKKEKRLTKMQRHAVNLMREPYTKKKKEIYKLRKDIRIFQRSMREEEHLEFARFLSKDQNNIYRVMQNSDPTGKINVIRLKDGELTSEPQEIANRMAEYLTSTFTEKQEEEKMDWNDTSVDGNRETFSSLTLTEGEVIKIIRSVKASNGRDSLNMSINMLKNSIGIIREFITTIINKSLDTSTVPTNLKRSFVRYIPKGQKATTEMQNLRPINVSPVLVKLIERGAKNKIAPNLVINGFFEDHQYGFLKGRATIHNLIYVTMKIQRAIKKGLSVIMIVTDFSKAFDKIPMDNVFKIVFGNFSSAWCEIISGLKQGSAAGPLAFIIAVNSLIQALPYGSSVMFADDQTIVVILSKITKDITFANDLLNRCYEWSKTSKLHYNVSKCQYIVMPVRPSLKPELFLGEEKISEKPFIESLGVLFSGRRKNFFEEHIDRLVRSVAVITNKILKKFKRTTFARKRHLLETYVRP